MNDFTRERVRDIDELDLDLELLPAMLYPNFFSEDLRDNRPVVDDHAARLLDAPLSMVLGTKAEGAQNLALHQLPCMEYIKVLFSGYSFRLFTLRSSHC